MRCHRERRGVSEIVGILVMVAVVVSLGVLVFGISNGAMSSLSRGYANRMTGYASARSENFVVEQVTFTSSGTVPITITNNQGSATPTTFQQKITWNPSSYSSYEASDLGNVRFCADSACATTLNAWLESCTSSCTTSATSATAWVKLTSAIGASGGTLTIYMVFQSTTVDFDANYWGEAPNLS